MDKTVFVPLCSFVLLASFIKYGFTLIFRRLDKMTDKMDKLNALHFRCQSEIIPHLTTRRETSEQIGLMQDRIGKIQDRIDKIACSAKSEQM